MGQLVSGWMGDDVVMENIQACYICKSLNRTPGACATIQERNRCYQ